jgi:hypothetical protein
MRGRLPAGGAHCPSCASCARSSTTRSSRRSRRLDGATLTRSPASTRPARARLPVVVAPSTILPTDVTLGRTSTTARRASSPAIQRSSSQRYWLSTTSRRSWASSRPAIRSPTSWRRACRRPTAGCRRRTSSRGAKSDTGRLALIDEAPRRVAGRVRIVGRRASRPDARAVCPAGRRPVDVTSDRISACRTLRASACARASERVGGQGRDARKGRRAVTSL